MPEISGRRDLNNAQRSALGVIVMIALGVRVLGIASEGLWIIRGGELGILAAPLVGALGKLCLRTSPTLRCTTHCSNFGRCSPARAKPVCVFYRRWPESLLVYFVFVFGRLALEDVEGTWIALGAAAIFALLTRSRFTSLRKLGHTLCRLSASR